MRFLLVIALVVLPSIARAEEDKDRAASLAESAVKLGRMGEFAEALALFEKAYALSPEPVLLYNIGRVAEKLRDWKKAAGALRAFLAVAKDDERREKAQEALDAVSAHLPAYVTVSCPVAGAEVEVDGMSAGRTPLQSPLEVKPGKHVLKVQASGKKPFEKAIEVKGTESVEVSARLEDEAPPPVAVKPDAPPPVATLLQTKPSSPRPASTSPQPLSMNGEGLRPASPLAIDGEGGQGGEVRSHGGEAWYKKWWLWTAVGAVVVGGATAAVLLTRPSGARSAADWDLVVQ